MFAGHERELEDLTEVFTTLDFGENQSVLISGLRGAGKTSMLSMLQEAATENGWLVISDDASRGLMSRVMDTWVPSLLNQLDPNARARLVGLGTWQFTAQWEFVDRVREVRPLLRNDLVALSEVLSQTRANAGILITIDEVSSSRVRLRELSRFALEVSHAIERGANIMIAFAGIRVDLDLLLEQEHTTFLRRSRPLDFRRLSPEETKRVLVETTGIAGKTIEPSALRLLVAFTQGYPYLVQLAGHYAWRSSGEAASIRLADAERAHGRAIKEVERRVISRVYQDLSPKDQEFAAAMAVDTGDSRMADVVQRMGVTPQYAQVYKKRLIASGYVQSPKRGYVTFSLPYLGDYIRAMSLDEDDDEPAGDGWDLVPPPRI